MDQQWLEITVDEPPGDHVKVRRTTAALDDIIGPMVADIPDLPGVMTYGKSRDEAVAHVQALALRVLADRLDHAEAAPNTRES